MNWTGQAFIGRREHLAQVRARRELSEPGVYLLLAEGEGDGDAIEMYVGGSDNFSDRFVQHAQSKDWWTQFVVFVSGVVIAEVGRNHVCVVHDLDEEDVHVAEPGIRPFFGRESRARFRSRWGGNGWIIEHPKGRPGAAILDYNEVICPETGASIDVQVLEDYIFDCPDCDGEIHTTSRGIPRHRRA